MMNLKQRHRADHKKMAFPFYPCLKFPTKMLAYHPLRSLGRQCLTHCLGVKSVILPQKNLILGNFPYLKISVFCSDKKFVLQAGMYLSLTFLLRSLNEPLWEASDENLSHDHFPSRFCITQDSPRDAHLSCNISCLEFMSLYICPKIQSQDKESLCLG